MGTRHLICVVKNGQYKVAQYGQWDGYPDGQGVGILTFLREEMYRTAFEEKIEKLSFLTEEELQARWVEAGAELGQKYIGKDIYDKFKELYPENNRDTGSDILSLIQSSNKDLKLLNRLNFAGDSLFCEWAYVIDFDKNTFEVYKGFNRNPLDEKERFYSFKTDGGYYPVKLIRSFDLDDLPTEEEFMEYFNDEEGDM